jgi:hypothetical protein
MLPTYTVVKSGLFSGFSLLPVSWFDSIAAQQRTKLKSTPALLAQIIAFIELNKKCENKSAMKRKIILSLSDNLPALLELPFVSTTVL